MSETTTPTRRQETPQQLTLLPAADHVPLPFRLSRRTRTVGLAGVAQVRAILAEQARRRTETELEAEHVPNRAA